MDKQINILMLGSHLNVKGGMTTVVESFLNNEFENSINIKFIPTHIENKIAFQIIFFIKSIVKIIYNLMFGNIKIVHMHLSERGSFIRKYIVFCICNIFHKKVIVHMHGAEFKEFYQNSNNIIKNKVVKLLTRADVVLVLGKQWEEYVLDLNNSINVVVLKNSVNTTKETINKYEENINILFLAVLIERKGIFDLIEAAKLINNENKLGKYNINFIIAGSGEQEQKCKEIVHHYGLEEQFKFVGWVNGEEKKKLLKNSHIFVLPSYNEGLPVAILEAMSYGIPVISTNVGSIEEAVKHEYTGFIHSPGDISMIKKYIEILINDSEIWNNLSINSKNVIAQEYDSNKYFKKIESLYLDLMEKGDCI